MATARVLPGAELLDDLCTRFILNVPPAELESFEKFMFLVEQAHWFYEDFCREKDTQLKSLSLKEFTSFIFGQCPGLAPFSHLLDDIYTRFNAYKATVPSMGAIILDPSMEKVLLVKGWQPSSGWGFPKGKVSKDETDHDCAVREVIEETGLDVSGRLVQSDFIEVHVRQQRSKLFIITGVEESTNFSPTVRKEISAFAWHLISELPSTREAANQIFHTSDGARHRFYMVHPFVKQLRTWIKSRRRQNNASQAVKSNGQGRASKKQTSTNSLKAEGAVAKPETKHVSAPEEPGQAWINFRFDQAAISKHLVFL